MREIVRGVMWEMRGSGGRNVEKVYLWKLFTTVVSIVH